jgi:hypothetical protein
MNDEQQKQLDELRELKERGLLSEAAYNAAVSGIQTTYNYFWS